MSGAVLPGIEDRGVAASRHVEDTVRLSGLQVRDWLDAPLADLFHETMLALARTTTAEPDAPSVQAKPAASPQSKADSETSLAFRALRKLHHATVNDGPPTIPPASPDHGPPPGTLLQPQDRVHECGPSGSTLMNVIKSNVTEHDVVRKPVPAFRHEPQEGTQPSPAGLAPLTAAPIVEALPGEPVSNPLAPESDAPSAHRPDVESIWTDIRALLDQFNSGSSIEMLDRRMQDLASKVDRQIGASSSALVEDLLQRIDTLQSSITGPIADRQALDELLFCLDERTGQGRAAPDDVQRLEEMMNSLAKRIEDVGDTSDPKDLTALHGQIERLSQRLDRSEASLHSLDAIEHSLRDLFTQLDHIRQTTVEVAESAARVAARETLRAAMDHPAVLHPSDPGPGLVEQVAHEVEELRHRHETSERRTQAALAGLQEAVETLVKRRVDPLAGGPIQGLHTAVAPSLDTIDHHVAAPAVPTGADWQQARPRSLWSAPDPRLSAALTGTDGDETASRHFDGEPVEVGLDIVDMSRGPVVRSAMNGLPSFIASARRSIQAAGMSAATEKPAFLRAASGASTSRALSSVMTRLGRTRSYVEPRRRPLMLTLAGLALLIGVFEIAQTEFGGPSSSLVAEADVVPSGGQSTSDAKPSATTADAATPGAAVADETGSVAPVEAVAAKPKAEVETQAPASGVKEAAQGANPFLAGALEGFAGLSEGLRAKALAGDPSAEYEVGLRFVQGRTVARDLKTGATWFEKAATHGSAPAQYRVGLAFEKGVGEPRDANLAMSWYGRAAEAGNVRAMHNLAVMTAEGAVGKPDYAKAAALFEKAAGFGVRDSQFNLAMLYARGLGVAQNRGRSYMWFALAAAQGDDDAAKKRDEIAVRLEPKVLETAKAAVENFRVAPRVPAANEVAIPPGGWDALTAPTQSDLSGPKAGPLKSSMLGSADPG